MSSPKYFRNGELQGKTVIETNGNRLGKAKEVAFSLDGTSVLYVEKDDGSESEVRSSKLIAIGEFIVVKSEGVQSPPIAPPPVIPQAPVAAPWPQPAQAPAPVSTPPAMSCRNCGAPLKPGSRFCTKCGTSSL